MASTETEDIGLIEEIQKVLLNDADFALNIFCF